MNQLISLKEDIHELKVSMKIVANSWKQAEKQISLKKKTRKWAILEL